MRCKYCNSPNADGEGFCTTCGYPLQAKDKAQPSQKQDASAITEIQCPHCGKSHPSTIWNCPITGAELPRESITNSKQAPPATARLAMENGEEIILNSSPRIVGRDDFDRLLSAHDLPYISRQHLVISLEESCYYIEDTGSKNGTSLNGLEIKQAGRKSLKSGDRIELGGVLTLMFKTV